MLIVGNFIIEKVDVLDERFILKAPSKRVFLVLFIGNKCFTICVNRDYSVVLLLSSLVWLFVLLF